MHIPKPYRYYKLADLAAVVGVSNETVPNLLGAITNGFTWQFLKLEEQTLYIDSQRYGLANLPQLLGAIQKVYDFYK